MDAQTTKYVNESVALYVKAVFAETDRIQRIEAEIDRLMEGFFLGPWKGFRMQRDVGEITNRLMHGWCRMRAALSTSGVGVAYIPPDGAIHWHLNNNFKKLVWVSSTERMRAQSVYNMFEFHRSPPARAKFVKLKFDARICEPEPEPAFSWIEAIGGPLS
jgi:hypothetical protein